MENSQTTQITIAINLKGLCEVSSKIDFSVREKSLLDIRKMNTPRIACGGNKSDGVVFIKVALVELGAYFGFSFTDAQVKILANEFYDNFKNWSVADLKMFSKRIIGGHYKIYGNFSPAILMELANQYDNEWFEVSEQISLNNHLKFKHVEQSASVDDRKSSIADQTAIHQLKVNQYVESLKQNNQ